MKTPAQITIAQNTYTVQPFEQYVLQFILNLYTQRDGVMALNNTLEAAAPLLEIVAEELCPDLGLIGFNRTMQIYYWKGDLASLAELVGELTCCHYEWQIEEMKIAGNDQALEAARIQLAQGRSQLAALRGEIEGDVPPEPRPSSTGKERLLAEQRRIDLELARLGEG